jgi:hypothetical protein
VENRAGSRPVLHNSTGPTATGERQAGAEENLRSANRKTLIACGTEIGGRSPVILVALFPYDDRNTFQDSLGPVFVEPRIVASDPLIVDLVTP